MATRWSCHECAVKGVEITTLCIYEEETGESRDFCFECGMKALKQRMLVLGEKEIVGGWHFAIPNLREEPYISTNYLL